MDFYFNIVMSLTAFLGLCVALFQLCSLKKQVSLMAKQMESQNEWQKMKASFELLQQSSLELNEIKKVLNKEFDFLLQDGSIIDENQMKAALERNHIRVALHNFIGFMDHTAMMVLYGYVNTLLIKDSLGAYIVSSYSKFKSYLYIRRKETKNNDIGNHFEQLAMKWEKC